MAQGHLQRAVEAKLIEHGYLPVYETAAVSLLTHPDRPDVLIRLGITRAVIELAGEEIDRASLDAFSMDRLAGLIPAPE